VIIRLKLYKQNLILFCKTHADVPFNNESLPCIQEITVGAKMLYPKKTLYHDNFLKNFEHF
jgi:hypothetical protein